MTRPDLSDPEQRLAYRRELQRVYRSWRYGALALLAAALVGSTVDSAHQSLWVILLVVGAVMTFAVIIARARYHQRRMRE